MFLPGDEFLLDLQRRNSLPTVNMIGCGAVNIVQ
jgi:hypothetical protein